MYTIGQFSRIVRVSAKTLRWYDEIGLFKPAEVDPETQYRHYLAEQVGTFQLILFLRDLGLGLDDIRQVLARGTGPEAFIPVLESQVEAVSARIETAEATLSRIRKALAELRRDGRMTVTSSVQVNLKDVPALEGASIRRRIAIKDVNALITEAARKLRGAPAGPPLCRYFDEDFDPEDTDVEVFFPAARGGDATLPAVKVASYLHVGTYDSLSEAYKNLFAWLNEHDLKLTGAIREVYLVGPESGKSPSEYVTEIQAPVGH